MAYAAILRAVAPGMGARVSALTIDQFVYALALAAVFGALQLEPIEIPGLVDHSPEQAALVPWAWGGWLAFLWLYPTLWNASALRGTPGKLAAGYLLLGPDGDTLALWRSALRTSLVGLYGALLLAPGYVADAVHGPAPPLPADPLAALGAGLPPMGPREQLALGLSLLAWVVVPVLMAVTIRGRPLHATLAGALYCRRDEVDRLRLALAGVPVS